MAPFPGSLLMWERGSKGQFLWYKKKISFWARVKLVLWAVRLGTGMGRSAS